LPIPDVLCQKWFLDHGWNAAEKASWERLHKRLAMPRRSGTVGGVVPSTKAYYLVNNDAAGTLRYAPQVGTLAPPPEPSPDTPEQYVVPTPSEIRQALDRLSIGKYVDAHVYAPFYPRVAEPAAAPPAGADGLTSTGR